MRQQHPVVVRALKAAIEPDAQPWEGWRTAGTLVIFRPLKATPWVEQELSRRESERAAQDAENEERLAYTDPGIQGDCRDLDDAAEVVARLLSAVERIDELERVAGDLPAQHGAREDAARARKESVATRRGLERTERQLESVRTEARAAGEGLVERLEAADQRAGALKTELDAGRDRLNAVGAHVDRLGTTVLETGELIASERVAGEERAAALSEGGLVRGFIEGSPERQAWGGFSSLIGRRSHSSSSVAAARESSDEVPPAWRASDVVNRSS